MGDGPVRVFGNIGDAVDIAANDANENVKSCDDSLLDEVVVSAEHGIVVVPVDGYYHSRV